MSITAARIDNIHPTDETIATICHSKSPAVAEVSLAEISFTQNIPNQWGVDAAYNKLTSQ
jgi:hypothetical protein